MWPDHFPASLFKEAQARLGAAYARTDRFERAAELLTNAETSLRIRFDRSRELGEFFYDLAWTLGNLDRCDRLKELLVAAEQLTPDEPIYDFSSVCRDAAPSDAGVR